MALYQWICVCRPKSTWLIVHHITSHSSLFEARNNKAVFKWLSKVIPRLQLLHWLGHWFKFFAPVYQPMRRKIRKTKPFFPALWASYMELLPIWISLLRCLHQLWLVEVITLVFLLRHSIYKYLISRLRKTASVGLKIYVFFFQNWKELFWYIAEAHQRGGSISTNPLS